ncbi:allantoinase AllB [Amycolatopsis pithecellobii]|uniref:allantoinase n=1 Tax=Amycolatopsis pithecellobii TaxID=664692 RepID=A0A6N7YQN1_9PSEU|nr:allantoinase AllB [Amycolatopsis pithecellobii]MTD55315.1 allantoinase AllB [Amycolatopsis pithecellobii]
MELVLRARHAVTAAGEGAFDVGVEGGRVVAVDEHGTLSGPRVVELRADEVLLPGLVDTHVHVNEPGRVEWEGFETATRAAAAGGITTIVDMPLNSVPATVDVPSLEAKRQAAAGRVYVDVGFWGGAIPGNSKELRGLHEAGVSGFKCFLLHSGVDEFPPLGAVELAADLRLLRELGAVMIVHAEDAATIEQASQPVGAQYKNFLNSRPREAENVAIARVIELAQRTGARAHILHLSSSDALAMIGQARRDGVALTVETCPHYLTFRAEEIPDGATEFKCCPPIRESRNRELLWQGLADGTIDCVVSDHSPCPPELKHTNDFGLAWGGISSLQVAFPAVWTGARDRGFTLAEVIRWMAERPAAQAGLTRKGRIDVGADADFCVFAPEEEFVVDVAKLWHRNPVSAYDGRTLTGLVRSTWLRGQEIGDQPRGELLVREGVS